MKRILTSWLLAAVAAAASFAQTMTDNHQLTQLWKQYEAAQKADRPQKEAEILAKIKKEAADKRLPVDFYDAATAYVRTVQRRDWKQQEKLREDFEAEVKAFAEPIVTFRWMKDWRYESSARLWAYVKAQQSGLQGCHRPFHTGMSQYLNGALVGFVRSDWEYVLWQLKDQPEALQALQEEIAGRYPAEAALAFHSLNDRYWPQEKREEQRKAYEDLAARYTGKAVSLFPKAELLAIRLEELDSGKGTSAQYLALCRDAQALEKERKAYKGDEATLAAACKYPAFLVEQLQASDLDVSVDKGRIVVALRNLSKADVRLLESKRVLHRWTLENPVKSFYVQDTVTVSLPSLPDGTYTIEAVNGKWSDQTEYVQYTLSIATRSDGNGRQVYVADYETGVPLQAVTLRLLKGDKEMARSSLSLNGFTPLPSAFTKILDADSRAYYSVEASSGNRKSQPAHAQDLFQGTRYDERLRCNIYRDRGAYNPGDTLQFKAVVFNGDPAKSLTVVPAKTVEVVLHDSEDNILETKSLTTNEWGSVSGSFVLPKGLRGGRFELEVKGLGYDWFRVDEFVLPTFDLSFDSLDRLFMTGDEIPVSGTLKSYSGHSLQEVSIRAKVQRYSALVLEQEVKVLDANKFSFSFPTQEPGHYNVSLTVTDPSGETLSFSRGYYVGDRLSVDASVKNVADAELILPDSGPAYKRSYTPKYLIESTVLQLALQARDNSGNAVPLPVAYKVLKADGTAIGSGETPSGELLTVELPESGLYSVEAEVSARKADGTAVQARQRFYVYALAPAEQRTGSDISRFFVSGPSEVGDAITARLGTAEGDAYAVVTLYGKDLQVLKMQQIRIQNGRVENLRLAYEAAWPDVVRLQVFYFLNGKAISYDREYRRAKDRYSLPLRFTRFQDKGYPGARYSFSLETAPEAEVLVSAWDKSLDAVAYNDWPLVNLREASVDNLYVSSVCGRVGSSNPRVVAYGSSLRTKSAAMPMQMNAVRMDDVMLETAEADEAIPFQLVEQKPSFGGLAQVDIRENFASALTFQPHLRPEADGSVHFEVKTSDKLSIFYVRAYAHDKQMRNALTEGEMLVTLPVKVSLLEPKFLYEGDVYDAVVTVSSVADAPVEGVIVLQAGSLMQEVPVTVAPGETLSRSFRIEAPTGNLTLTAGFRAAEFSDAVRVTLPVRPAAQTLTEAHSAVLHAGEDREALLRELRSRFVNVPGTDALLKEITVLDMVKDAIPSHVEPKGNDVLSLSEAWYIGLMASRLEIPDQVGDDPGPFDGDVIPGSDRVSPLLEKILACRNADGGFGWFEGMNSSPIITAVMLERFAKLRDRGFAVPELSETVKYLDKNQFDEVRPYWCGWLSDAQYMHVRACYPEVPFAVNPVTQAQQKRWKQFRKDAKSYLTPSAKDGRGLQGRILEKARRLLTLRHLGASAEGKALAKAWGIGLSSKLEKSALADVRSLLEYAVEHRDGGWYYPNAVMPWRGLLESEAYAHAMLCDLLKETPDQAGGDGVIPGPDRVSDGIRLWLMLQKETQHWDTDPAFIDAITAILDGSEAVLSTRVLALSASFEAPFSAVKAAGNGFTIGRKFLREDGSALADGDTLRVGERITLQYDIWNAENRSFVKLTAGREAALSPVQQLSGHVGYGFIRPLRSGVVFGFVPQGYRHVKADATEYFFDSYPEEKTTVSEDFFVTRAGVFHAPAVTIESLYAPHYRANTSGPAPLVSRF